MPTGIYDRSTPTVLAQYKERSEQMKLKWANPTFREHMSKHLKSASEKRWVRDRKGIYPHNVKMIPEYREMLNRIYGNVCFVCQHSGGRLELHHLWYEMDSEQRSGQGTINRMIEAMQHPERFVRLCRSCHSAVTMIVQHGPEILGKYIQVVEMGMEKQNG